MTANSISFTDDNILRCPFAAYQTLRDEHPIYRDPVTGMFIVTRFEDIKAVSRNVAQFSNNTGKLADAAFNIDDEANHILAENAYPRLRTLISADPPVHTKFRSMVDRAFSVLRIRRIEPYIEQVSRDCVATFIDQGRAEFVSAMAMPMPVYIIADQLGVSKDRYLEFKRWSDALLMISDTRQPPDVRAGHARALVEMQRFLEAQTKLYRQTPADNIFSDVANGQVDGRPLTEDEVVSIVTQLLVAGNETTTNTMSAGLQMMIEGGHEAALRDDPSKMGVFVEEVLRLTTALQGLFRRATEDTEIAGVKIPKDSIVMLRWAAGNRDERHFPRAEEIDLARPDASRHLAFGSGIHFCIGNQLARAELRIAFKVLLDSVRNLRFADEPDAQQWLLHPFARGMTKLRIEFDRVS